MIIAALVRDASAAAAAAGAAGVARAVDRIVARAGGVPALTAEAGPDGVALRGPGLRARAFGSRRRSADPRIAGLGRGEAE